MIDRVRVFARQMLRKAGRQLPGLRTEFRQLDELRVRIASYGRYPAGHYYSTIPDWQAIKNEPPATNRDFIFRGIDLNDRGQLALLKQLAEKHAGAAQVGSDLLGPLYQWPNLFFHWTDAAILTGIIAHFRPQKIVEVGCGYSSAVISDALNKMDFLVERTLIDPDLSRTRSLIPPQNLVGAAMHERTVQQVEIKELISLSAGDVLFIDSSHVTKHRSDVNFLLFEVLPQLAPGVLIHFHDIFVPFDYPLIWYGERRGWNEIFLIRAFLQFNSEFTIVAFADYLRRKWPTDMAAAIGGISNDTGNSEAYPYASLWLRKV